MVFVLEKKKVGEVHKSWNVQASQNQLGHVADVAHSSLKCFAVIDLRCACMFEFQTFGWTFFCDTSFMNPPGQCAPLQCAMICHADVQCALTTMCGHRSDVLSASLREPPAEG